MNIENLFSTSERIKILEAVLFQTDQLSVNHIAGQLRLSKGLVSKYLDLLVKEGVAKRINGKFLVNYAEPVVKGIKVLLNVERINLSFLKKHPYVQAAGLYGSCAKGENQQDSDADLWILMKEISEEKKAALAAEIRKRIKGAKPLFLTREKIKAIKKEDETFYHALSFGSMTLYGISSALEF